MFYIKRVTVTGKDKPDSTITFSEKLNIIYGPSNCGKTMVLNCIDYLLGAKEEPFSVEDYGYSEAEMLLGTDNGDVLLKREIGTNTGHILSQNPLVKSGDYSLSSTNAPLTYGQALLGLLGISLTAPIPVFSTKEAATQSLSLRMLIGSFVVKEEPIIGVKNVLVPTGESITALKASMLYLLTGNNFITGKEKTPEWMTSKRSVKKYIEERKTELENQNDWLTMPIFGGIEDTISDKAQAEIESLDKEYDELQRKYSDANKQSYEITKQVTELSDRLAEEDDLLKKFEVLHGQYDADVKRMHFILDGKAVEPGIKEAEKCPFCGGIVKHETEEDCIQAAKDELAELEPKIHDLEIDTAGVTEERKKTASDLEEAKKKQAAIDELIQSEIKPKIQSIKGAITQYGQSCREAEQKAITRGEYDKLDNDYSSVCQEIKDAITEFDPDIHFGKLDTDMSQRLISALGDCHFPNSQNARFDIPSFDVVIGPKKKGGFGKGYRAFLNSVCAFTLHDYLNAKGKYFGMPFIIDSPVLSLKEIEKEKKNKVYESDPQAMKGPLFQYFLKKSEKCQTIVIENDVPPFEAGDTHFIHYTADDSDPENYGFLKGVR